MIAYFFVINYEAIITYSRFFYWCTFSIFEISWCSFSLWYYSHHTHFKSIVILFMLIFVLLLVPIFCFSFDAHFSYSVDAYFWSFCPCNFPVFVINFMHIIYLFIYLLGKHPHLKPQTKQQELGPIAGPHCHRLYYRKRYSKMKYMYTLLAKVTSHKVLATYGIKCCYILSPIHSLYIYILNGKIKQCFVS